VFALLGIALWIGVSLRARERLRPGGAVLLGLVPFFIVPLLVRMAFRLDFASATAWRIVAVAAVATLVGVVCTGLIARLLLPSPEETGERGASR